MKSWCFERRNKIDQSLDKSTKRCGKSIQTDKIRDEKGGIRIETEIFKIVIMKYFKNLYATIQKPSANLILNKEKFKAFLLTSGTRQECSFSLYLIKYLKSLLEQ